MILGSGSSAVQYALDEAKLHHHQLQVGDGIMGEYVISHKFNPLAYEITSLRVINEAPEPKKGPPYHGLLPPLSEYQRLGCRRLSEKTYNEKCQTCAFGALMEVDMIIDHWKPSYREHREETFCFGPIKCKTYRSGPKRKVPGRKGMVYTEENWVDEDAVSQRDEDE
jgi:hypothetical protein